MAHGCTMTPQGVAYYVKVTGATELTYADYVELVRLRPAAAWAAGLDDDLIGALWRRGGGTWHQEPRRRGRPLIRPSEWDWPQASPPPRPKSWIDYWTAVRSAQVKSKPDPNQCAAAWALGIPVRYMQTACAWRIIWPSAWRGNRQRIRLLMKMSQNETFVYWDFNYLTTGELRRLSKLPAAAVKAGVVVCEDAWQEYSSTAPPQKLVDWDATAQRLREWAALPRDVLRRARIVSYDWLAWGALTDAQKKCIGSVATVMDVIAEMWGDAARQESAKLLRADNLLQRYRQSNGATGASEDDSSSMRTIYAWSVIIKHGRLRWWVGLKGQNPRGLCSNATLVCKALNSGWVPSMKTKTIAQAVEDIHASAGVLNINVAERDRISREVAALHRARDQLAQRQPEWAITKWRSEYERGVSLGPLMRQVIDYLRRCADDGWALVVLGRDGEIIHHLLQRIGVQSIYMIASRPLTTHVAADSRQAAAFERMVNRVLTAPRLAGRRVMFVDTGFAGSIPRWLQRLGSTIGDLSRPKMAAGWSAATSDFRLVSANDALKAIPITGVVNSRLRDIVLTDLEHASQRLTLPRPLCDIDNADDLAFGQMLYSADAPGYWSRLYGICDALGLPRRGRWRS